MTKKQFSQGYKPYIVYTETQTLVPAGTGYYKTIKTGGYDKIKSVSWAFDAGTTGAQVQMLANSQQSYQIVLSSSSQINSTFGVTDVASETTQFLLKNNDTLDRHVNWGVFIQ